MSPRSATCGFKIARVLPGPLSQTPGTDVRTLHRTRPARSRTTSVSWVRSPRSPRRWRPARRRSS
eukprot:2352559-Rhodomonas_salina.3